MRERILECLGTFPKKVDLNLVELESIEKGNYFQKLIEYNVEENERVKSYLLIPKGTNKAPGILAVHQHNNDWDVGKSEVVGLTNNTMYSYGVDLVNRGYVVIAPDIICFEDRKGDGKFNIDKDSKARFERYKFCDYLIHGTTLQTKTLHDLSVAVDVLSSLEYVESDKIGVVGHSLGGQEAIWLEWYDKRIKVGASSCGLSMMKDIIEDKIIHSFYLYIPNMLKYCDFDELIREITVDRKLIMSSGLKDERHCPISGIKTIEKNNNNSNFKSIIFDGDHQFGDNEKKEMYDFIDDIIMKGNNTNERNA